MTRLFQFLVRPAVLVGVLAALVGAAAVVVFQSEPGLSKPQPLAVGPGEQEVAFLYPATSSNAWERFAAAVELSCARLQGVYPGLSMRRDTAAVAFPGVLPRSERDAGAAVSPSVSVTWPGPAGRVVFRWYKLTSDWSPRAWAEALLARDPPPLAVIGGNNSYWGRELALAFAAASADVPADRLPLLLLTTATADRVPGAGPSGNADAGLVEVAKIYPGRTFRFCFTNRQMATAITRFIWSRAELRPDGDPAFLAQWNDDAYSLDLVSGYKRVLDHRAADNLLQQWLFVTGCVGLRLPPVTLAGWYTSSFRHDVNAPLWIDSSVGSFAAPNPYEAKAVQDLLARLQGNGGAVFPGPPLEGATAAPAGPRRPLLVVTGQAQASRRFLRELARSAPETARRFVVALGDTVPFNAIYRDRLVNWPIQDLPFETVFFCHRNPIDAASGFRPLRPTGPDRHTEEADQARSVSGTEDLLLFGDVAVALGLAYAPGGRPCPGPAELGRRLLGVHLAGGRLNAGGRGVPLFRPDGQRSSGTGEHVVYLRPTFQGDRVVPEAVIEVWYRETNGERSHVWHPYGKPLTVSYRETYDEFRPPAEKTHGGD
jgi:hypothetical protein